MIYVEVVNRARSPVVLQNITEFITPSSLRISNNINDRVDTCMFEMVSKSLDLNDFPFIPHVLQEIYVYGDDFQGNRVIIFGGIISRYTQGIHKKGFIKYDVECQDWRQLFNKRLVVESYENTTLFTLVTELVNKYANDEAIGPGGGFIVHRSNLRGPDIDIPSVAFDRLTLTECFQRLAEMSYYSWYIDHQKNVHFFSEQSETAPFNINTGLSDDQDFVYSSLRWHQDGTQLRNKIFVRGDYGEVETETGQEVGSFTTSFVPDNYEGSVAYISLPIAYRKKPNVWISLRNVGFAYLVDYPYNVRHRLRVGVLGLDRFQDNHVMWDSDGNNLIYDSASSGGNIDVTDVFPPGTIPPNVSLWHLNLHMQGGAQAPIFSVVRNRASIATYGTYESYVKETLIGTKQETIRRGNIELLEYALPRFAGSFKTYTPGLKAGQLLWLKVPKRGIDQRVILERVTTTVRDNMGEKLLYNVTFRQIHT